MRFFFGKTPSERAREQLATQRARERFSWGEAGVPLSAADRGPVMRRIDPIGRAAFDDARIDPLLVKYSMGLALIAMRLVREHGLELEHADHLNLPDAIPPVGPFEFTATTRTGSMHFVCSHEGSGTVRIQTDRTGSAEWEVNLRSDRERELSH